MNDGSAPRAAAVSPIDWAAYYAGIDAELHLSSGHAAEAIARHIAATGRFQNTDYPISLTPVVVSRAFHDAHAARVSAYLALLEKVARMVIDTPAHQDYLGLTEDEVAFAAAPVRGHRIVQVCRLDGYVDAGTGQLKILEHNADSPAGTFFTPRLNRVIRAALADLAPDLAARLATAQFDDPMALWDFLAAQTPDGGPMRLEIVQETGKSNVESQEMAVAMRALGHACKVSDPAEIGDANVLWNKINTVYWRETVARRPDLLPVWSKIVTDPACNSLNHFAARAIVENKRCLAFMQDPRHQGLFSAEEHALIARMCPWAAICDDAIDVTWRGTTGPLRDLLLGNKDAFVLKQPFDIRGDGVSIGKDCSPDDWRALVAEAFEGRYTVQEHIPPMQLPIVTRGEGWTPVTMMNTSLDTFVFGGQVEGYGAKASTLNRVNLFKGGRKLSALIGSAE